MRLKEFIQNAERSVSIVFFDENHKKVDEITLSSRLGMSEIDRRAKDIMSKSGYSSYETSNIAIDKGEQL